MVLYTIKRLLHIAVAVGVSPLWAATPQEQAAAREVIARFAGEHMPPLELGSVPVENDCAVYTYQTAGGKLHLQGSSGVALCKGYYDFVRSQGKGKDAIRIGRVGISTMSQKNTRHLLQAGFHGNIY